jgi:hypothetical protein
VGPLTETTVTDTDFTMIVALKPTNLTLTLTIYRKILFYVFARYRYMRRSSTDQKRMSRRRRRDSQTYNQYQ